MTLTDGELELLGLLPGASNYTFLAKLSQRLVVYKPRDGEAPLWDFPEGTLYKREMAAYILSELLGWGIVPETTVREGPHGIGAVQVFIEHDPSMTAFELGREFDRDLMRIALFDLVANNADRKAGHLFLDSMKRLWAVDHGICFHEEFKVRTVLWDFVGMSIPSEDLGALQNLCNSFDETSATLREWLLEEEIAAVRDRAGSLLKAKTFPPPPPGRSFPWPPV